MKLLLTILTNHKLDKLKRLVNNVLRLLPEPNIELTTIIVVNTLDDAYYQEVLKEQFPFPVIRTESNGKPGKGKNSCLELFCQSSCDFVTQFDGDDILYPTYLNSIWQHVKHYPNLDVLGAIPCDFISNVQPQGGYIFELSGGYWASVWGTSMCDPRSERGPARGGWLDAELPSSHDYTILQSKLSAKYRLDENLPVGEDHLYTMELLSYHQRGMLRYFQTMSSDMYLIDRTTENSIQKIYPQIDHVQEMKDKGLRFLKEYRTSFAELPLIYKDLLMSQYDKEAWVKKLFNT